MQCHFCQRETVHSPKHMVFICNRHKHPPLKLSDDGVWLWLSIGNNKQEYQACWYFCGDKLTSFELWKSNVRNPIILIDGAGAECLTPDNIADKLRTLLAFV